MSPLKDFEAALKDVVQAKRLSESKMNRMTEAALKCMEDDTQLVSILYRRHKSLPVDKKIHGLYAFNALACAARHKVNKHGITGDINAEKGNCATFLLKLDGVLDGLFKDMLATGNSECKEKTKKVLDIWVKSNTFPSAVLTRLSDILKGSAKESNVNAPPVTETKSTPVPTPTLPVTTTPPVAPPISPAADAQSTLLALLSQAATALGQTPTNTPAVGGPQLDANQLALLQQLKQSVAAPAVPGPSSATPTPPPVVLPPHVAVPGPPSAYANAQPPPPFTNDRYGPGPRDPRYGRYDGGGFNRRREEQYDERRDFRSGPRDNFRGRGRGRWDDRDPRGHFNDRDGDRGPPRRERLSRSRSPPRVRYGAGGRRDVPSYSPPPRTGTPTGVAANTPGKDEFGRDIRPESPTQDVMQSGSSAKEQMPVRSPSVPTSITSASDADAMPAGPATVPGAAAPNDLPQVAPATQNIGLAAFDFTTFDPTAPASWEALGTAWQITNGYAPSQEELMQFIMGGFMGAAAPVPSATVSVQQQPWPNSGNSTRGGGSERGNWRGGDRGRGFSGRGRGNGREAYSSYDYGGNQVSDAIVLNAAPLEDQQSVSSDMAEPSGSSGGRMQKVGDKWVFVRGTDKAPAP
ncbi:hypothetical protein PUNSTDRAFT_112962 [Punctularia strigosozonata HHB-11173 SS5]|uniref:uncharacterized protein n=1 Tax=Punctularia strigosozonata (strain HHB-11173) TaxID=741275 RepID=UPI000441748C|nr:uncharacterized protein PUNSTDRAFT_112962 [Punctularia strigosozonata HHB-11173 SS5]EIN09505.1 hypothetical protein PUNSTDRAFT_112962 [Punctularia strigosozonata HHB-11173 SS5]